jgi:hypothetical protein
LYYPLAISSEYYKFDENTRENKAKIQELRQMIKCDVTDIFITELHRLTDSELHFHHWANSVFVCINTHSIESRVRFQTNLFEFLGLD